MIKTLAAQVGEYKRASFATPIFMILEVIMEMLIPLMMASIIDNGVEKGDINHIIMIGIIMVIAASFGLFCGIMGGIFGAKASAGFARNLRKAMFERIQTFSFSNIDRFSTASLITRMTTDVTNLQNSYQMILRMCFRAPLSLICAMAMSFYVNARLASVYLAAVLILGCILVFIVKNAMKYFTQMFRKYDDLNSSVQENVTAIRVVKAFVREEHEKTLFEKACDGLYRIACKAERIVALNAPVMMMSVYSCILVISWLGAKMIIQNALTTGELMMLLTYCMNILMNLMMLSLVFVMLTLSVPSAERICQVLTEEADIVNPEDPIYQVPNGEIIFDHVSFRYNESSEKPVLHDINLVIRPGETIGIIGGTGSSKSSLVNLISRLYDVSEGSLKVGGHDVREYDIETIRNEVSVVLQKNVLFSGTILENLRWGDQDATMEECVKACQLACADEFIDKLPDGYNTYIEQGGTNVSGGQKQRLCIARALLKHPKILILDDSTSAVDTATDAKIRKAFREEIPDTTKLIISQRISSVQDSDRILVLENGEINGLGTHEELLRENEIYREVYESQNREMSQEEGGVTDGPEK
ncbi:MAG: ABC transporter ATP-binding protein [Eubacterium sp.]|nr:ABC transporter ATP-binding protein [Eubacterium sp.]